MVPGVLLRRVLSAGALLTAASILWGTGGERVIAMGGMHVALRDHLGDPLSVNPARTVFVRPVVLTGVDISVRRTFSPADFFVNFAETERLESGWTAACLLFVPLGGTMFGCLARTDDYRDAVRWVYGPGSLVQEDRPYRAAGGEWVIGARFGDGALGAQAMLYPDISYEWQYRADVAIGSDRRYTARFDSSAQERLSGIRLGFVWMPRPGWTVDCVVANSASHAGGRLDTAEIDGERYLKPDDDLYPYRWWRSVSWQAESMVSGELSNQVVVALAVGSYPWSTVGTDAVSAGSYDVLRAVSRSGWAAGGVRFTPDAATTVGTEFSYTHAMIDEEWRYWNLGTGSPAPKTTASEQWDIVVMRTGAERFLRPFLAVRFGIAKALLCRLRTETRDHIEETSRRLTEYNNLEYLWDAGFSVDYAAAGVEMRLGEWCLTYTLAALLTHSGSRHLIAVSRFW